ncbi:MAG: tetratricopeptide repeat protein [Desulfobacteraceae bacterium]|jgi:tetratricopeptide (TPR) repeat protein
MTDKINKIMKVSFFAVFVFLHLSGPVLCQEDKKKEEKPRITREAQLAMVDAQKFFENEDYTSARKPLLDYLATNPEVIDEQVYLMLGYCWYRDGNLKEALKVFKKGHEENPDNFDLLSYYTTILYETEDFAKAAPLMEELYNRDEKKQERFLEAAWGAYYQIEKFDDTIRILKKLIKESKEVKQNWYTMIFQIYYNDIRDLNKAEKFLYEALDLYPMEPRYWNNLSLIRQEKEDYYGMAGAYEIYSYVKPPQKQREWNQLISIERNLSLPLREARNLRKSINDDINKEEESIMIADAYARALKIDKAVSYIDNILKKRPSSKLMLKKAEILYNSRRNKEAITACDALIAVNADEGGGIVYYLKGNAAWDLEDWDTMEKAFKRAQSYKKYKAHAKYALGFVDSLNEAEKQIKGSYR